MSHKFSWWAAAASGRADSNADSSSALGRRLSHSLARYREIVREWKSQPMWQFHCLTLRNGHGHPGLTAISIKADSPPAEGLKLAEGSEDGRRFVAVRIFSLRCAHCFFLDIMLSQTEQTKCSVSITFHALGNQTVPGATLLWHLLYCGGLDPNCGISGVCLRPEGSLGDLCECLFTMGNDFLGIETPWKKLQVTCRCD